MVTTIALLVAISIPVSYLFVIYKRDFFQTGNLRVVLACFLWGVGAYYIAVQVNSELVRSQLITRDVMVRFTAPIVEEILKCAILIYLIRRSDFTYFVDGAIYGFTAGIGFAIVENFEYIFSHPSAALALALARVFSTNLIHATASGSIGIALGISRFERAGSSRRLVILLVSVILAMGLHMAFNNLVSGGAPIALAILVGLAGAGLIVGIMRRGLDEMKLWVDEELGTEKRMTHGEAEIVSRFENVDQILKSFTARFGPQNGSLARELLLAQAHIGIYKRTAEKHQEESMRRAAEEQVAELRITMDEARKKLGLYCMLYLRGIFPEEGSPALGRLQLVIESRGESAKSLKGTGLWTDLSRKTAKPVPEGEEPV
ncbi:MAG: PrsW family intramembrane metalloprotease [Anaerolineales bacterium]|nr:PrsW family intramembrane metalloprotease [Anaerolineales bacterium]